MGRRIVIVAFLACLGMAVGVFLGRDTTSVRQQIEKANSAQKPRIVLGYFTARRYRQAELSHAVSASKATLVNPSLLLVEGGVKGWQKRPNGHEQTLACERALAYFAAENLATLPGSGDVEAIHLQGFVKLDVAEHALTTDSAKYLVMEDLVVGDKPVRVAGPERWFAGRDGFKLQLKQETLDVFGPVRGMVTPHARQ